MDLNTVREILLEIDKIGIGESIQIDELAKNFPNIKIEDILLIISRLASRYYVRIDGKYSHECYNIEKYNRILGLERDGLEAIDYIKNDKIWSKVQMCLNDNGYNDFSIFTAVELAKEIVKREFTNILNN